MHSKHITSIQKCNHIQQITIRCNRSNIKEQLIPFHFSKIHIWTYVNKIYFIDIHDEEMLELQKKKVTCIWNILVNNNCLWGRVYSLPRRHENLEAMPRKLILALSRHYMVTCQWCMNTVGVFGTAECPSNHSKFLNVLFIHHSCCYIYLIKLTTRLVLRWFESVKKYRF